MELPVVGGGEVGSVVLEELECPEVFWPKYVVIAIFLCSKGH